MPPGSNPEARKSPPSTNCDPQAPTPQGTLTMNGNGPPHGNGLPTGPPGAPPIAPPIGGPQRLRPPPAGPGGKKRSPSTDSTALANRPPGMQPPVMPPGGAPPRQRVSRTPMSPEERALLQQQEQARQAQAQASRDCFIIPQQSVERFLPDGIAVRNFSFPKISYQIYTGPTYTTRNLVDTVCSNHF